MDLQPAAPALPNDPLPPSARRIVAVGALSAALSAVLLMSVQPLWSRLSLPLAGGAPSVWTVSLAAFQALLLLGYGLAERLGALPIRLRRAAHLALLVAALTLQPASIAANAQLDDPLSLLLALLTTVGLPFVALSLSTTLLQLHVRDLLLGVDPYLLYAASNAGSLLGLLAQPFVADRLLGVRSQTSLWAVGLLVLTVLLGVQYARRSLPRQVEAASAPEAGVLGRVAAVKWLVWSLLPAALLTALSTWLSTTVAAVPMLWVLPLGLYLLTFVLVFQRARPPQAAVERAAVLLATPVLLLLATGANHPVELVAGLHLLGFFAVSMACHGRLAAARPAPAHLAQYWLLQAAGGALGGAFAALAAPLLFSGAEEYPLLFGLSLAAGVASRPQATQPLWRSGLAAAGVIGLGAAGLLLDGPAGLVARSVAAVACFVLSRQRLAYALAAFALPLFSLLPKAGGPQVLASARSFFGVHRVLERQDGVRELYHGVTMHGRLDPHQPPCTPLLYYTQSGPIGQVLLQRGLASDARVGAVGLGIGSLACYAQPQQRWQFFEIDADVEALARSAFGFPWGRPAAVVLGDARRTLEATPAQFDLLILDAYSSDAIPLHLLTVEAGDLYLRRLRPGGIAAFHISNRYFDLEPVLAGWAAARGLTMRLRDDAVVLPSEQALGKSESRWVVVARNPADLGPLALDRRWREPARKLELPWSDDRASALDVWQAWNGD